MKPTANTPVMPQALRSRKHASGSSTKWHTTPTSSARGWAKMRRKSPTVSPRPSENMMNARMSGSSTPETMSPCMMAPQKV